MSNYSALKTAIQQAVYTNGNNEITGAGLQAVLLQIVNTVGDGYVFKGVATAGTSPGTPDANVFYIAPAGTYTNFGSSYTVNEGCIGVFMYDGSWAKSSISTADISTYYKEINASSTAQWLNLPDSFKGRVVLMRADVTTESGVTCRGNTGTDDLTLVYPNMWCYLDFTTATAPRLYIQSTTSQTFKIQAFVSPTLTGEMERSNKIIKVKTSADGLASGDFATNNGTQIFCYQQSGNVQNVYPTSGKPNYRGLDFSDSDVYMWMGYLSQFYKSRLARLVNENWVGDILKGITVQPSNFGFLKNDGIAASQSTNQGNSYTDFIPVVKGTRIHVHGGYYSGTYNYTLFGYRSIYDGTTENNTALSPTTDNSMQDYIVEITDPNIRYVRMWSSTASGFVGDAGAPFVRILPPKNTAYDVVVDANGEGDFTNLYQAIKATSYMVGHASIYVKAGSYEMPKVAHTSAFAANRKLSIIGESKESVIIYNNDGEYTNGQGAVDSAPLRLSGNVTIKNVTIRSISTEYSGGGTPASYCVHVDFQAPDGSIMEIENCRMYNDHYACIGIGLQAGFTLKIRNCELYSKSHATFEHNAWNGAIICHDGSTAGNPQRIEMCDNVIECTGDHAVSIIPAYSNQIDALFIGNAIFAAGTPVHKGSPVVIDSRTCLNNITIS